MHHRFRYSKHFNLKVVFYGEDISLQEKETARQLIAANVVNLGGAEPQVEFMTIEELMGENIC
jgi:hypothetical protein